MKLRLFALGVLFAGAFACRQAESAHPAKPPKRVARITVVTDRTTLESLDRMPLPEAHRRRLEIYRLRPDRRFLIALGELELLVNHSPNVRLHAAWGGEAWRLDSASAVIGEVPEIAGFGDMWGVAERWAEHLVVSAGSKAHAAELSQADISEIRKQCDRFEPEGAIRALQRIDAAWPATGLPSPAMAALAGRAFTQLSVMSLDTLELADVLPARALAMLALARALGHPPEPEVEALLATGFDDFPEAQRLSSGLAADDPLRLYAAGAHRRLRESVEAKNSDRRSEYLALLLLGRRSDGAGLAKFAQEHFGGKAFSLTVLRAAAQDESFGSKGRVGNATVYAVLEELTGPREGDTNEDAPAIESGPGGFGEPIFGDRITAAFVALVRQRQHLQPAGLVRRFEESLERATASARGPLWDGPAARGWYRGFFYSGLQMIGSRYFDELGDVESTRELAQYLEGSPEGVASQLARWYGDLSAIASGGAATDQYFDDLIALSGIGGASVRQLAEPLQKQFYRKFYSAAVLTERVAGRLDARRENVAYMVKLADDPLRDVRLREQLCKGWRARDWHDLYDETSGHCLSLPGKPVRLLSMLNDRGTDPQARTFLLTRYANSEGADEALCRAQFATLAAETGWSAPLVQFWEAYLRDKLKDYAAAQRAVQGYLERHGSGDGFQANVFRGRLARDVSLQGRHAEAWRIVEPELQGGQAGVLCTGAEILMRLGRIDEAYKLARSTVDRYPDVGRARSVLAGVLWRQRRYSEAAFVLDPPEAGYKVSLSDFKYEVSRSFGEVMTKAPDADVMSAVAALQSQGVRPGSIACLIPPLAEAGRFEAAFLAQSKLVSFRQHPWEVADWKREGFDYLEKARGRAEAVAWIRTAIPPGILDDVLAGFFRRRAWSLLWDAVPENAVLGHPEALWLARTGAVTLDGPTSRVHRDELLDYYRSSPPGATRAIGRYLLGLDDRASAFAVLSTPVERCQAAFFVGLPDLAAGRQEEALDWFQLAYATCAKRETWEYQVLSDTAITNWRSGSVRQKPGARTH